MAEPVVKVPAKDKAAALQLAALSSESFDALVAALQHAAPRLNFSALARDIDWLPEPEIEGLKEQIIRVAAMVYRAAYTYSHPTEDVIASVTQDFAPEEEQPLIKERLARLLAIPAIRTSGSGGPEITQQANSFLDVKFAADLRLLPRSDEAAEAFQVALVHQMRITYQRNRREQQIDLALDDDEILALKQAIDDAIDDTQRLRAATGSHLSCLLVGS